MKSRHQQAVHDLTIVKLGKAFFGSAVALGELEYRLFKKIFKIRSVKKNKRVKGVEFKEIRKTEKIRYKKVQSKKVRQPVFWPMVAKLLISLGYVVSQIFVWPVKKTWIAIKAVVKGFWLTGKVLVYALLVWPWQQLDLLVVKIKKLVNKSFNKSISSVKVLPARTINSARSIRRIRIRPHLSFIKPVLGFALLIILFVLPLKLYDNYQFLNELKGRVIGVSQAAIGDLFLAKTAIEAKDFNQAKQSFSQASANFLNAQNQLEVINNSLFVLAKIAPSQTIQLAGNSKHFIKAGQLASEVGVNVAAAVDSFLINTKGKKFTDILSDFSGYGYQALTKAEVLENEIKQIDYQVIPEEYLDEFIAMRDQAKFLKTSLKELLDIADNLQIFLGDYYDQRYLLVFQNNTEIRATGGFMGSFATVDFSQGDIENIKTPKGGTYDTEAGLRVLVKAPEPLRLVNPLWHLWDSNWWPDWPTSAKKIMWFYEKSSGPTVDGVISLTPTVLEKLIKVIGPIDMTEDYGVIINADNFLKTVQEFAEQKPNETVEPKRIIGDLLLKIIDKISVDLDRSKLISLIDVIDSSLQEKQILLYFTDDRLEAKINELNWGGRIKETDMDYLSVINTNIRGGKSDRDMEQTIYLDSTIRPDGTVVNELTIERQHQSIRGERFSGVRNVDWMRIYVPAGSQLISATGFKRPDPELFEKPDPAWVSDPDLANEEELAVIDEATGVKIYQEGSKTVFADWSMVEPGETTIIRLSYKLPFKLTKSAEPIKLIDKLKTLVQPEETYEYTLLVQKQPGALKTKFYYNLEMQQDLKMIWSYPDSTDEQLSTDKYWARLFTSSNN